jgi:nicotinate-nucleotide adenylyltransferase
LGVKVPGKVICPGHQSPLDYLRASFFDQQDLLVWANRGGGKTFMAAVATILDALYRAPIHIRVLGGSFDPVHNGHLAIARAALRHFRLGTLLLIPAGIPPHKTSSIQAPAADRLAMLRAATAGERGIEIWDGELRRRGRSFTIDTLEELRRDRPGCDIRFIIGSDNLDEIKTWRRYPAILGSVTLCVARRPGYGVTVPAELAHARIVPFPAPELDISSTMIREAIARRRPWERLVPQAVAAYIKAHGLYIAEQRHAR